MDKSIDFRNRRHFPGTVGNPFDIALRKIVGLEKIPALLFGLILFVLAFIVYRLDWMRVLLLWAFLLADWVLLARLPAAGVSFGPAKPVVLMLALARIPFAFLPAPFSWIFQLAGTLLVIYGFWIEPQQITVTRQQLRTNKLPTGSKITLLHLGDLHIERVTAREKLLNQQIQALKPDVILFSGDFLNLSYLEDPAAWDACGKIISAWQSPCGTFAVKGSPAVDLDHVVPILLQGMPVRLLDDQQVTVTKDNAVIQITGLTCTHKPFEDGPRLAALQPDTSRVFSVLLHHSPDLAPEAAALGMDLQLSGHTHGGQVRLPWIGAIFAASLYGKRYESGRYQVGPMTLYTTRGIGLEGQGAPRVRFLCPPEIIYWEITGV